ncbi:membrane hypothetical protein [Capnocytophaga canis]|uniref:Uncharacterized protein n=1 Tax=Capnocytophaga canis TaxID=1848903 RepID=A0A0B7IPB8_9FLAO|nr:membrane hypothetical protein [Capnocytophaga canis]
MSQKISKKSQLLIYLYFINTAILLGIYLFDYESSIFIHFIQFLLLILLNRVLNNFQENSKYDSLMYISEVFFIIFIMFIIIFKNEYFSFYKLFLVPSFFTSIVLSMNIKKLY